MYTEMRNDKCRNNYWVDRQVGEPYRYCTEGKFECKKILLIEVPSYFLRLYVYFEDDRDIVERNC